MSSGDHPSLAAAPEAASSHDTTSIGTIRAFIDAVNTLASDPSFKETTSIMDEYSRSQKQIERMNDEILGFKKEIKDLEMKKDITYKELSETNQRERGKQKTLSEQIRSLEADIRNGKVSLDEQEKASQKSAEALKACQESYNSEKKKVEQAHQDISRLQATLRERDTVIDRMKEAGKGINQKVTNLEKNLGDSKNETATLRQELQEKSGKLRKLEAFAGEYENGEEKSLMKRMDNLWVFACTTVVSHLKDDLPPESLQNQEAWRKLKSPSILLHNVPLPQSNSNAAKQMRCVVILAILAREIDRHIFQPTYLLREDSGIRELLIDLAMENSDKESFCRSLFQTVSPELQSRNAERRIRKVVDNVCGYVSDLLPKTQFEQLLHGLDQVVRKAYEIGAILQRTKKKYNPDFEPEEWGDSGWDSLSFMEAEVPTVNGEGEPDEDDNLLIVFPRTCLVNDDDGRNPCDYVTVLRRSHALAAERELKKKDPPSPVIGRGASSRTRGRRLSIALRQED